MKQKILIVEDDESLAGILQKKFSQLGYTVLRAKDGEEGLDMALEQHPDCVVLDILMPKMKGTEVLNALRIDKWGANVPIVMLTNVNRVEEVIGEIMGTEPTFYLVKADNSLNEIVSKVEEAMGVK